MLDSVWIGQSPEAVMETRNCSHATPCLTLDLLDDAHAISEYKRYHETIWPDVRDSLFASGITDMEIYLLGTRMFMIMDVDDEFTMERKAAMDAANAKVQAWETIMRGFQKYLPEAQPGEKWVPIEMVLSPAEQ